MTCCWVAYIKRLAVRAEHALSMALRAMTARTAHRPIKPSMTHRSAVGPLPAASGDVDGPHSVAEPHAGDTPANARMVEAPTIMEDGSSKKQVRRRGRPTKIGSQDSMVVEWWKPGWQKKSR
jgi:hypothetical protein